MTPLAAPPRRARFLSGVAFALGALAPSRATAADAGPLSAFEHALAIAEASLQRGDLRAAERHYGEALREGWMTLGTLHRLEGQAAAARAAFEQAVRAAPGHRDAVHSLATAHIQSGAPDAAVDVLRALAAADPRDVKTRLLLAKALAAAGQRERALATLQEASAAAAADPEALFLVAAEHVWLRNPEGAEPLFSRVLDARPLPQTRVLIGRTYRDAGDYDRARAHLRAALAQDPAARRAHYYLGMVALADARAGAERLQEAIAEFRAELALDPRDGLAADQLGRALLDAGRLAEAREALEAAVATQPRPAALLHLGRALLALGQPAEAAAALRRALAAGEAGDMSPADLEAAHYQLGLALRRLGQAEEAGRHLEEARRLSHQQQGAGPETAAPLVEASPLADVPRTERSAMVARVVTALARASMNLGVIRARDRDFAAATDLLARAAELRPDLPRVQYSLGVAAFNAGRYETAAEALTRAAAEQPDSAELSVILGQAHAHLARDADAVEALTRALRLRPDVPEAHATLGLVYLRQGRLDEAEAALRAALRARPEDAAARANLATTLERIAGRRRKDAP